MLVSPPDWNISITNIWISIKVCIDVQIVAPSPGQHLYLLIILLHDKILANKQTLTCSIPVIYDVSVLDLHQGKWVIVGQKDIST